MAYGTRIFHQDGFPERMDRDAIADAYPVLPREVHELAQLMLSAASDRLPVSIHYLETPALAVRALKLNIGGRLPTYDYNGLDLTLQESGETREIEEKDMFTIAHGPHPLDDSSPFNFAAILERVTPLEPVQPAPRHPILTAMLHAAAAVR